MRIKAVIFDMDGVILDTESVCAECTREMARRHSLPDVEDYLLHTTGTNSIRYRMLFETYYGKYLDFEAFETEIDQLIHDAFSVSGIPVKKGADELLRYLQGKRYKIALATSTAYEGACSELKSVNLLDYFDYIVTGDMVKNSKPAPDIFLKACEVMGVETTDAIIIEDSFNGVRAAAAAGIFPIMVPDLIQPDEEIRQTAGIIKGDLLEVKDWMERWISS